LYNKTLEYINERVVRGDALLIAPEKPLEISRVCHDSETMQRVYDLGRHAAEKLPQSQLRQFIKA
jgi:predicted patatin/cPLA2 family phospholipase